MTYNIKDLSKRRVDWFHVLFSHVYDEHTRAEKDDGKATNAGSKYTPRQRRAHDVIRKLLAEYDATQDWITKYLSDSLS